METISETIERVPKKILEIGTGRFPMVGDIEGVDARMDNVVSFDINEKELRSGVHTQESLRVVGTAFELPFADGSFTHIVLSNVFGDPRFLLNKRDTQYKAGRSPNDYWIEQGNTLFAEFARVLQAGGELAILEGYTPDIAEDLLLHYKNGIESYFYSVGSSSLGLQKEDDGSIQISPKYYSTYYFFKKK
jgi:ubiquinone/menaquinone biosynthesis C-methylase UbiE